MIITAYGHHSVTIAMLTVQAKDKVAVLVALIDVMLRCRKA